MIRLYDFTLSGNAHKVRNFLGILGLEHERIPVDLGAGAHKTPEFLALNPKGQVPVLADGADVVFDSQAILVYLGRKYGAGRWLPVDAAGEAQVQAWLSTAANEMAAGPGQARLIALFGAAGDPDAARTRAEALLDLFEGHLAGRDWLVGSHATIADIANYSYIALAPDAGIDPRARPAVARWMSRVERLPGFEPVPAPRHAA